MTAVTLPAEPAHWKVGDPVPDRPTWLMGRMSYISAEMEYVPKRGQNTHFNYRYALESDIMAALRPLLAKWGVFYRFQPQPERFTSRLHAQREGKPPELLYELTVLIEWVNTDNPADVFSSEWIAHAIDNSDKGPNKAYTAAAKYAMLKTFLVSTGDDPEDGEMDERLAEAGTVAVRPAPARPAQALGPRPAPSRPPVRDDEWARAAVKTVLEAGATGTGTTITKVTFDFGGGDIRTAALFGTGGRLRICEDAEQHGTEVEVKLRSKEYRGTTEYQVEDVREARGPAADNDDEGPPPLPVDGDDIPF